MKFRLFVFIFFIISKLYGASVPEIGIKNLSITKKGNGNYSVTFKTTYRGLDPDIFSDEESVIFNEIDIMRGPLRSGMLTEQDILFSQKNQDLDGDGKHNGKFPVVWKSGKLYINGIDVFKTRKRDSSRKAISPRNEIGQDNIVKVTSGGASFNVRDYNPSGRVMEIGILDSREPVIKIGSSAVMIEVITAGKTSSPKIENLKSYNGRISINDDRMANEGPLERVWALKEVKTLPGEVSREIVLKNMPAGFKLRITYLFTISKNLILYKEKTDYVGIK